MSIRTELTSIRAWFSGLFTKETKTMSLTATETTLTVGSTTQLTSTESATFASGNAAVLTVDATGLVTAVGIGSASVIATSAADTTQTASITFTVNAAAVVVPASVPAAAAAPVAVPVATAVVVTDTDKLKALLVTLGHDIEAEWDHLIALVQKEI